MYKIAKGNGMIGKLIDVKSRQPSSHKQKGPKRKKIYVSQKHIFFYFEMVYLLSWKLYPVCNIHKAINEEIPEHF